MSRLKLENGFHIQPKAQAPNTHEIFLYGTIGWEISVDKFWEQVNNIPASVTELDFYINSDGGYVWDGYALLTNLDRLKEKYHTRGHIDGLAASMASAFVVNMHEVIASPTSKMIIHDPWAYVDIFGGFNSKKIEELIEDLQSIKASLDGDGQILAGVYARKTGLSVAEVRSKWMEDGKDHHFTPEEMVAAGLADKIAESKFVKPPSVVEQEEDEWLTGMLMHGRKAASSRDWKEMAYRGNREKVIARFALNLKNDYDSLDEKSKSNPDEIMTFAQIAKLLGLDPSVDEATILSKVQKMQARIVKLENDETQNQKLIDQLQESKTSNEAKITELETDLRNSQTGSVVDSVIDEVTKNVQGKQVNKNIREQLVALAADHLKAKAENDERMEKNTLSHMKLLAESNLVPVGENKDLKELPGGDRKEKSEGTLDKDTLEAARAKGEEKRKKMFARHQKAAKA